MPRLASILAATVLAVVPVHAAVAAKSVDCDKLKNDNAHLQQAVDNARPGTQVQVKGTCEDVALVITRSGVGLVGPAVLEGTGAAPVIRVQDAGGVSLEDLEVTSGTNGIEVAAARVAATNVDANNNSVDGISVVQSGALECNGCVASDNGARGLLVIGSASLCGANTFNDNGDGTVGSGILMFLGGRVFSSAPVCDGTPTVTTNGNDEYGLNMFQNAGAFFDGATVTSSSNGFRGATVFDSSALTVRGGSITISGNASDGLVMGSSSAVRLTDLGAGTTSVTGNTGIGVIIVDGGNLVGANMTITGNAILDVFVEGFGTFDASGASTLGPVFCTLGESSGTGCP